MRRMRSATLKSLETAACGYLPTKASTQFQRIETMYAIWLKWQQNQTYDDIRVGQPKQT